MQQSRWRRGSVMLRSRRTWGSVSAGAFFPQVAAEPHQEMMGEQRHRQVMMPAAPGAHFVVIHAKFVFALLDGLLDRPAHAQQPDQGLLGHVSRRVA